VLTKGGRRSGNKGESENGKWRGIVPSDPGWSSRYHGVANMTTAQRQPKVVVLGGGSWGTTIASICARRGPTLQWVRSEATAKDINENHRNSRYLGNDVVLSETLRATTDFAEAANCADVIVMGVPSHGFRKVLTELASELRPWVPVVSLVKGLEQGTNMRMSQIVEEVLPGHPAGILAGPNIAREVAEGYAAAAVLAMPDQHLAANLAELFRTKRFRTYTTDDVVGVEMAGALKKSTRLPSAWATQSVSGKTPAMVMTRAVREMSKLGEAAGGHRDTFAGLAGMGDLIVTCTSQRSRNRHVGEQLGAGKQIDEIIASMNQVAEGVKAASVVMEFAKSYGLSMPIAREVDGVINHGATPEGAYRGLAAEKPGHELHGAGF
jgi:glycerol-3-phosphate dehydrogenase (NAD(P)+)